MKRAAWLAAAVMLTLVGVAQSSWQALAMLLSGLAILAGFRVLGRLHPGSHGMTAPQTMLVLGMLGMLAGLLLDAQGPGLAMLTALCSSGSAMNVPTMLSLHWQWLPAMHVGMLAGGLATMPWLRLTRQHCRRQLCARVAQNIGCFAWMLAGMSISVLVFQPASASAMLAGMFAGMVWGMVAGVAMIRLYFKMTAQSTKTASMTGEQEGV
ncbi:hypothetical protein [Actimicrobium antarcticum]|uniref:Uncharacterized protein n=1 Tax=Actimicrobium antarcticum TaxID=1051899 RepID=A0ABP7T842_9BURK